MTRIKDDFTNSRIGWIDWAKSFCMYLVILGHCHIRGSEQFVVQYIYSFHMMFFFFLSGMLCKRELSISSIKKDIKYIILPYFTYGLILITFYFCRARSLEINMLIRNFESLCLGDDISIGPIWFLPALFVCKQLFLLAKRLKLFSICLYYLLFVLSFFSVYYISKYHLNIPFFVDSALCGLPFFFAGNECNLFIDKYRTIKWYVLAGLFILLLGVSVASFCYNGCANLASCTFGQSVYAYYVVAFSAIISNSILCIMIGNLRSSFVTCMAYGSIVTLGLHGIPLTLLNYYLPIAFGKEPSTYSLYQAFFYSIITLYFCYLCILFLDKRCPSLFGLRGTWNNSR